MFGVSGFVSESFGHQFMFAQFVSDFVLAEFLFVLMFKFMFMFLFAEGVHGYGESRGIAAIPSRWKWALFALAAAALAFVWSRARRFGPPDRASRALPPARADGVEHWFLQEKGDVRSSFQLEVAATEFQIQGLDFSICYLNII